VSRERRRYVAVTPNGTGRERTARHKAVEDVAREVEKYLRTRTSDGRSTAGSPAEWATWALRWPRRAWIPAPDGSEWSVTTRWDYV
jgi:hypothetical protein